MVAHYVVIHLIATHPVQHAQLAVGDNRLEVYYMPPVLAPGKLRQWI